MGLMTTETSNKMMFKIVFTVVLFVCIGFVSGRYYGKVTGMPGHYGVDTLVPGTNKCSTKTANFQRCKTGRYKVSVCNRHNECCSGRCTYESKSIMWKNRPTCFPEKKKYK